MKNPLPVEVSAKPHVAPLAFRRISSRIIFPRCFLALLFLLPLASAPVCAQIKSMDDFRERKVQFYCMESDEKALEEISAEMKLLQDNRNLYGEEDYLTIENNLVIERINFMGSDSEAKKERYLLLNNQSLKNDLLMKDKKTKDFSSDYLVSFGDIKTRLLEFLSSAQVITQAMSARDLFLAAIKNDKKSSAAYMSYALWLYFAPPIVGGGSIESYKTFLKAEKYAKTSDELYFVLIYKSQVLFAMDRKQDAYAALDQAHDLFTEEKFTHFVREKNEQGSIFFD